MTKQSRKAVPKRIETLQHDEATRLNIPTAEQQSFVPKAQQGPVAVKYPRNPDLDPQLMWRGKDEQDWSELVVQAPPLYIQEKVHPRVLIEDLLAETQRRSKQVPAAQPDLFGDFNGLPDDDARTDFYQHEQHWTNRMILGDSLQVMASLAEREALRGKVQCIYFDPPYGIKFNSNFQWSTTSRDVKDGNKEHITREPEQVKAFRDTWRDGIHSYLTYLRDRLTVARDLLTESGSIFVQIGDENVHRVRAVMDEVFGEDNFVSQIAFRTTANLIGNNLGSNSDYILWYSKSINNVKYRQIYKNRTLDDDIGQRYTRIELSDFSRRSMNSEERNDSTRLPPSASPYTHGDLTSQGATTSGGFLFDYKRQSFSPAAGRHWTTSPEGMRRAEKTNRVVAPSPNSVRFIRYLNDFPAAEISSVWSDTATGAFTDNKVYVVQTNTKVIERCILMATDPGDLVLDPTCGSGTTAYVAEQWGRRWITIDTSRVALALARARIMGARYPYYLLADSVEGQIKDAEVTRTPPKNTPTHGSVRQGFVYRRVPHITLKSIATNTEIDVIWDEWQATLEPLRAELNTMLERIYEEWEIPRQAEDAWSVEVSKLWSNIRTASQDAGAISLKVAAWLLSLNQKLERSYTAATLPERPADPWSPEAQELHARWWAARIARQQAIDASIAARAETEYLYDQPYTDEKRVRVAGPFTVESLSPHRMLGVDEHGELIDPASKPEVQETQSFETMILENLKTAGVQQADKSGRITFTALTPWPGQLVNAEGTYLEGDSQKRAAVFIGPEFGTVQRADLVRAAREASEAGFDLLVACAFNFEAHTTEFNKMGALPILKARMNADLHMGGDLKPTGAGNLFVVFGEPDIEILPLADDQLQVRVNGVDVFHPASGKVESDNADGIACWFIDTDYNEESFFVRHAYFLGAGDPYTSLKTTLKAEIDMEAWESLNSDLSRPFAKPTGGRIAVKVINHLGDEVMKVFSVA